MANEMFHPPADLPDMDAIANARAAWHLTMSTFFRQGVQRATRWVGAGNSQFFDHLANPPRGALQEATITWNGFPKSLADGNSSERALQLAEQLRQVDGGGGRTVSIRPQDEYLEWHATRDARGRVVAVDFTCEGPEYWMALAHGYPASIRPGAGAPAARGSLELVLSLYRRYVSPDVELDDLLDGGRYDPNNAWNTERGAMHLTHPSNALQAEVFLAADSSVVRQSRGVVIEDDSDLIACAQFGLATRASDPTIGGQVNALARAGALVSLRNPVGLYIDGLDDTGWTKPDGSPVGDYWKILRGTPDAIVRARYEVPAGERFVVSDIEIGGEPIRYPGQLARHITMKLTGVAAEVGRHRANPVGCVSAGLAPPMPLAFGDELASLASTQSRRVGA